MKFACFNKFTILSFFILIASCQSVPKQEIVTPEKSFIKPKKVEVVQKIEKKEKYNPAKDPNLSFVPVHFELDRYEVRSSDKENLELLAAWLENFPERAIKVAGHADERGSIDYNMSLGEKRAAHVKEFLSRKGIVPERVEVISYGEELPVDSKSSEHAWSKNRRAEFIKAN